MTIKGRYIPDRDKWIMNLCVGKKVLHVGCTDWPVTDDRLERSELLHQKLAGVCEFLVGVDPDEAGITKLMRFMPHHTFHVSRAEDMRSNAEIARTPWDIVLAADVVEHISNLGAALDSISSLMLPYTKLLITTPSSFSFKRFFAWSLGNKEHVHADHCYYFSPSTMHQILSRSGLKVEEYGFFMWKNDRLINTLARYILFPLNVITSGRMGDELALSCSSCRRLNDIDL